jgi:hypothetical protein
VSALDDLGLHAPERTPCFDNGRGIMVPARGRSLCDAEQRPAELSSDLQAVELHGHTTPTTSRPRVPAICARLRTADELVDAPPYPSAPQSRPTPCSPKPK